MRDIPVFTTENGVASLVFREIPYKGIAYITLQDSLAPVELLQECRDMCRVAGASRIYATGHACLDTYPLHTAVWQMRICQDALQKTDAALFPVTENTLEHWRSIYNEKMADVPNSATMTLSDAKLHLQKGDGYFVHKDGELMGIGIASGKTVEAVIGVKPHAGMQVLLALCGALFTDVVELEVASANLPAVRLYERAGFIKTAERSLWHDVTKI